MHVLTKTSISTNFANSSDGSDRASSICLAVHCFVPCGHWGLCIELEPAGKSGERLNPFLVWYSCVKDLLVKDTRVRIKRIRILRSSQSLEAILLLQMILT